MDAIEAVEKEIEKVISKFSGIQKESKQTIDEVISVLSVCMSSLCEYLQRSDVFFLQFNNLSE